MRRFSLFVGLLVLCAGCTEPSGEPVAIPVPEDDPKSPPLGCTLKGDATCEAGKTPKIIVSLINKTNADILLVGSLDGSDCKMRFPHCVFEVTGPNGKSAVKPIGRCGNMNVLRAKDFVKVPTGGAFDPFMRVDDGGFFSAHQLSPENFREPGVYRIRFVYSTKSDEVGTWAGDAGKALAANAEVMKLFKQVPRVEVRSEEIAVTVVAPSK